MDFFCIYFLITEKNILQCDDVLPKYNDWIGLYKLDLDHLLNLTYQLFLKHVGVKENKYIFLPYPMKINLSNLLI